MKIKHNMIRYNCATCGKISTNQTRLKIHILNKHEGVVWPCTICQFKGATPKTLAEHLRYIHSTNPKKHKCLECGVLFANRSWLTLHERVHTGKKPYTCKYCERNFRRKAPKKHRLGQCINLNNEDLKIKCEYCDFISINQDILKLHALGHQISVVDIMKKLPLSIREASFKTEDEFQTAVKIFFEKNPFTNSENNLLASNYDGLADECKEGGKKLALKTLRVHGQNITKELGVKCNVCLKTMTVSSLKRHTKRAHEQDNKN